MWSTPNYKYDNSKLFGLFILPPVILKILHASGETHSKYSHKITQLCLIHSFLPYFGQIINKFHQSSNIKSKGNLFLLVCFKTFYYIFCLSLLIFTIVSNVQYLM